MQAAMSARLRWLWASHGRRDARDRRLATFSRPLLQGLRYNVLQVSAHVPSALIGARDQSASASSAARVPAASHHARASMHRKSRRSLIELASVRAFFGRGCHRRQGSIGEDSHI